MPKVVGFVGKKTVVKTSLRVEHALVMKVFASVTKVYCIYPHFKYIIINILTIATVYYIVVDARLYLSQTVQLHILRCHDNRECHLQPVNITS